MSPFLLAFEAISVTSANGLVAKFCELQCNLGPVARSLVSANCWLRGIKMYTFPWYLTLVSTNHASSNPGLDVSVDFKTTERVSVTQEGNLSHDKL